MGQFDYLLGAKVPQVDPLQIAQQGMALSQLADANTLRQLQIAQQRRSDAAQDAYTRALPMLFKGGAMSPENYAAAIQQFPQAAMLIDDKYDKSRKTDAEIASSTATANEKNTKAKMEVLKPLSQMAFSLANKPGPIADTDIAQFNDVLARHGLQNAVPTLPFQKWTDQNAVRQYMGTLGAAFYTAHEQTSDKETNRTHLVTEGQNAEKNAAQMSRWQAETSQGWARLKQDALSPPQEVLVNGVPTLASFNRKGGGWADASTGQRITGAVQPKPPEMPGSVKKDIAQNNVTLASIDNAIAAVSARGKSLGPMNALPWGDFIAQWTDPAGTGARALVAGVGGQKFHDLSGAAISVQEAARLAPYIPQVKDRADVAIAKLQNLRREIAQMQSELAQGYNIHDVASRAPTASPRGDAGQIGGAQPPAPVQFNGITITPSPGR